MEMDTTPQLRFRPDIQGLRALAVVMVLAFHLGWEDVSGGYVGVDAFFVVSGYLITAVILRERAQTGRFDFARFSLRRLKRLFPALAVTVLATLGLAAFVLPPQHAEATARSALAAITYTENVLAWREAGYFDAGAASKPLLHAWSLGVEEQFYLAWPLLMMLGYRASGVRGALAAAALAGVASFAANLLVSDPGAIFFLAPFRVFEFAVGALVWAIPPRCLPSGWRAGTVVGLGLASLLYAGLEYDEAMVFPGTAALLPCLGAAAVLAAGDRTRAFAWLLENRAAMFLGRISYSLYLVHWPVFLAYVALRFPGATYVSLSEIDAAAALAASLVLGTALHHGVEAPLRRARLLPRHALTTGSGALAGLAALAVLVGQAVPPRLAPTLAVATGDRAAGLRAVLRYYDEEQEQKYTWQAIRAADAPFGDGYKLLIVGDSQAADLVNVLSLAPGMSGVSLRALPSQKQCQVHFVPAFYEDGTYLTEGGERGVAERCAERREAIRADPRIAKADTVALAFAWYPGAEDHLADEVAAYRALGARRIVLLGKKDLGGGSLTMIGGAAGDLALSERTAGTLPHEVAALNAALAAASPVPVLGLHEALSGSRGRPLLTEDGYPVYYDARHFTARGAAWAAGTDGIEGLVRTLTADEQP